MDGNRFPDRFSDTAGRANDEIIRALERLAVDGAPAVLWPP
jgi:hypothetical protein